MKTDAEINAGIAEIKREIQGIDLFFPGSLYRCGEYDRGSFCVAGKRGTIHIKKNNSDKLKMRVCEYQRLKQLVERWKILSLAANEY